jgi:hypothetical protein
VSFLFVFQFLMHQSIFFLEIENLSYLFEINQKVFIADIYFLMLDFIPFYRVLEFFAIACHKFPDLLLCNPIYFISHDFSNFINRQLVGIKRICLPACDGDGISIL